MLIPFLMTLGKYGTIIAGVDVAYRGARKLSAGTTVEPVIAGFGDTVQSVLDPLDLTGYRAGKAKKAAAELDKAQDMSASANARAKAERQARKVAEQQAKEAKKQAAAAMAKADKMAREAEKKLAKAETEKDRIQAQRLKDQATAMTRYGQLATRAAEKAEKKEDPGAGLAMAQAAFEFAKQAAAPLTAIAAINSAQTPEGKAFAASLTDAINRDDVEFDPEQILRSLERGDPEALDAAASLDVEGPDHSHEVAGSCCASCSLGAESCGTRTVPDGLINGDVAGSDDDDADSFMAYFLGDDEAASILAGPVDSAPRRDDSPFFAPARESDGETLGDADVWGVNEDLATLFDRQAAL